MSSGQVFVGTGAEFLYTSLEYFLSESTGVRQSPSLVLIIHCIDVRRASELYVDIRNCEWTVLGVGGGQVQTTSGCSAFSSITHFGNVALSYSQCVLLELPLTESTVNVLLSVLSVISTDSMSFLQPHRTNSLTEYYIICVIRASEQLVTTRKEVSLTHNLDPFYWSSCSVYSFPSP